MKKCKFFEILYTLELTVRSKVMLFNHLILSVYVFFHLEKDVKKLTIQSFEEKLNIRYRKNI